jgi:hypothetical protein
MAPIEVRENIGHGIFLDKYLVPGTPVNLAGFLKSWPAYTKWSPRYMSEKLGSTMISAMRIRNGPSGGTAGPYTDSIDLSVKTLMDLIDVGDAAVSDLYVVAHNRALALEGMADLWSDMKLEAPWFDPEKARRGANLWAGPKGTVTPLHYDLEPVLLAQVYGAKRVIMAPPGDGQYLYKTGGYSSVDPEQYDYENFPLTQHLHLHRVCINAGDMLFIPPNWWHHVRALTGSISLSFANFD